MDATTLIASLQEAVPGAQLEGVPSVDLQTTIYVSRDDVPAVARALRDRPELAFNLLAEITAVDFWPREPRFELVYILVSIPNRLRAAAEGAAARRRCARRDGERRLAGGQLARARGLGSVRHRRSTAIPIRGGC